MGWKNSRRFFDQHRLFQKCSIDGSDSGDPHARRVALRGKRVAIDVHKWLHEMLGSRKFRGLDQGDESETIVQNTNDLVTAVLQRDRGSFRNKQDGIILEELQAIVEVERCTDCA